MGVVITAMQGSSAVWTWAWGDFWAKEGWWNPHLILYGFCLNFNSFKCAI